MNIQKYIHFYLANFAAFFTIGVFVLLAFSVQFFPYLNLYAHLFSTLLLLGALIFALQAFAIQHVDHYKVLLIVLVVSYLFDLVGLAYHSEIIGNVFYLLLLYTVITSAFAHRNDI